MPKRVLIVDDHPLFREGLRAIINDSGEYICAGEAQDGKQAMELANRLAPDFITMDISLPDTTGLALVGKILLDMPDTKIVICSMHARPEFVREAFQMGAVGYVLKDCGASEFITAMNTISLGRRYVDASLIEALGYLSGNTDNTQYSTLTKREQEIFLLVAKGMTSKDIAEMLSISPKTVDNHRLSLMRKLNLRNAVEVAHHAVRLGIIEKI